MSKMDTQNPKFRRYSSEQRRQMLIEAGLACLSRGGMLEFTIDKICAEADVSRGLITHHFKSKEGLLTAVYATMYERMVTLVVPSDVRLPDIVSMTNAMFDPRLFGRESVNVWLALWGEIANNAELMREHRRQYGAFRRSISAAIRRVAKARPRRQSGTAGDDVYLAGRWALARAMRRSRPDVGEGGAGFLFPNARGVPGALGAQSQVLM